MGSKDSHATPFFEWMSQNKEEDPKNVTFLVGNNPGTKFVLNQKELEEASLEFKNILKEGPIRANVYEILDISDKDFQILIEHIFKLNTWKFHNLPETLKLLKLIDRFHLHALQSEILKELRQIIFGGDELFDCDTIFQAFCLFSNFKDEILADAAREFILTNVNHLLQSENFLGLSFQEVLLLLFRYEEDDPLPSFRAEDMQSALLKWMLHNNAQKKGEKENVPLNVSQNDALLSIKDSPNSNPEQQTTVKNSNKELTETILDVLQRNLSQLTHENEKMQSQIICQNEELKKISEDVKELQKREKLFQAEKLQMQEVKLEQENPDEKIKHINLLLQNRLKQQAQMDQKLQSKSDAQENHLKPLEKAFCDFRAEEKTRNYGNLVEQTTLTANPAASEIPDQTVEQIPTFPGTNNDVQSDRLMISTSLKSQLKTMTEDFAIGFMIYNLSQSTLKMEENYFNWTGATVQGNLPGEIKPGSTESFMLAATNSITGFLAYKLDSNKLFIIKYCIETYKQNRSDIQLAWCPFSVKRGMELFEEIRNESWDNYSDRIKKFAHTRNFTQRSKLSTCIAFGNLHASVTMKTGKKAMVSIVISDALI